MPRLELFPRADVVGLFRGFREGGLEFHADLVLPYRNDFQSLPMHGQFVLVQLETPDEAVLGRITAFASDGKLTSPSGEEFNIRAIRDQREVPDDLREEYLRYRVNIRVLGVVRVKDQGGLTFVPSHRRLPHVGSRVAFASGEVLRELAGHNAPGAAIGTFALGEYVYGSAGDGIVVEDWMQFRSPTVKVQFPVENLVSRRSFVFARAGFGKSNLVKLLFSKLYEATPMVKKRGGTEVPVGTVIFDPDGEYFWPDDRGRPGLADVAALKDQLVVFTPRNAPSAYYGSFVAGGIRLDIRRLRPADVMAIALGPDRQEQQNVRKLATLNQEAWEKLVNLIDQQGNQASIEEVCEILQLNKDRQEAEAYAARSNVTRIVRAIHDRSSSLMDMLMEALSEGKLCVVDVSQMRGQQALVLSGLILRRIFDKNQQEFTNAIPSTIPTIAVVEEAQSVLNESATSAEPYIAWVKEGRKYDLGAVLITQQPGSIPVEILSQGDNWFIFHLLSAADLSNVKRSNAHFSDDLLSVLLNEPIPGQGVFWSSVGTSPYPLSIRALSFELSAPVADPEYRRKAEDIYASKLRQKFASLFEKARRSPSRSGATAVPSRNGVMSDQAPLDLFGTSADEEVDDSSELPVDVLEVYRRQAIEQFSENADAQRRLASERGVAWGEIRDILASYLPAALDDRQQEGFKLVKRALDEVIGSGRWTSFNGGASGNRRFVKKTEA